MWDWKTRQDPGSEKALMGRIKDVGFNAKCNEKAHDFYCIYLKLKEKKIH